VRGVTVKWTDTAVRCYPLERRHVERKDLKQAKPDSVHFVLACMVKIVGMFDYFHDIADDSRNGNVECLQANARIPTLKPLPLKDQ
jgi:hypothetical protein